MILNTQIHNPSTSDVKRDSWTTTEVAAQKAVESHNEVQKVVKRVSQNHQQQGNEAHSVAETKKTASKKSEATESTKSETGTLNSTLDIERTATSTSTRP